MTGKNSDGKVVLRSHQREGLRWMADRELCVGLNSTKCRGGILADDMGLGKTHQAVALVHNRAKQETTPTLIVVPTHLLAEWKRVCCDFGLSTLVVTTEAVSKIVLSPRIQVVLVGHSCFSASKILESVLVQTKFRRLIIDEAHICKNDNRFSENIVRVEAEIVFCLTGTPIVNNKNDLTSLFHVITKDYETAEKLAADPDMVKRMVLKRGKHILPNLPKLVTERTLVDIRNVKTYRCIYRIGKDLSKDSVVDEDDIGDAYYDSCDSDSDASLEYSEPLLDSTTFADDDAYALADSADSSKKRKRVDVFDTDSVVVALLRMRQLCESDDAKIRRLIKDHRKHPSNTKSLVFFTYTNSAVKAERALRKASDLDLTIMRYDGTVAPLERPRLIEEFKNARGNVTMFVQYEAGGSGLNMQAAQRVYLLSPHWNVCIEEQAICRAHRMNSRHSEIVATRYVAKGTVEEWMSLRHLQQKTLMKQLERYSECNDVGEDDCVKFFNDFRFDFV